MNELKIIRETIKHYENEHSDKTNTYFYSQNNHQYTLFTPAFSLKKLQKHMEIYLDNGVELDLLDNTYFFSRSLNHAEPAQEQFLCMNALSLINTYSKINNIGKVQCNLLNLSLSSVLTNERIKNIDDNLVKWELCRIVKQNQTIQSSASHEEKRDSTTLDLYLSGLRHDIILDKKTILPEHLNIINNQLQELNFPQMKLNRTYQLPITPTAKKAIDDIFLENKLPVILNYI